METFLIPIIIITYSVIYQIYNIQARQYEPNGFEFKKPFQPKDVLRQSGDDYCMQTYNSCKQQVNYFQKNSNTAINLRREAEKPQVCAHSSVTGLNNFYSPCDIAYTNCKIRRPLIMSRKYQNATSVASKDTYYYNGQNKPCSFYLKSTSSLAQAVQLYYATRK